MHFNDTLEWH